MKEYSDDDVPSGGENARRKRRKSTVAPAPSPSDINMFALLGSVSVQPPREPNSGFEEPDRNSCDAAGELRDTALGAGIFRRGAG